MDLNLNKVSDFEDFEAVCGLKFMFNSKQKLNSSVLAQENLRIFPT